MNNKSYYPENDFNIFQMNSQDNIINSDTLYQSKQLSDFKYDHNSSEISPNNSFQQISSTHSQSQCKPDNYSYTSENYFSTSNNYDANTDLIRNNYDNYCFNNNNNYKNDTYSNNFTSIGDHHQLPYVNDYSFSSASHYPYGNYNNSEFQGNHANYYPHSIQYPITNTLNSQNTNENVFQHNETVFPSCSNNSISLSTPPWQNNYIYHNTPNIGFSYLHSNDSSLYAHNNLSSKCSDQTFSHNLNFGPPNRYYNSFCTKDMPPPKSLTSTSSENITFYYAPFAKDTLIDNSSILKSEDTVIQNISEIKQNCNLLPDSKKQQGWECAECTYFNEPTRPGCEMCSSSRPDDYIIPVGYEMNLSERNRSLLEKQMDLKFQHSNVEKEKLASTERQINWINILKTADNALIPVFEKFECPICFDEIIEGGVLLRECLHSFCKDCLKDHIINADEAEIKCPFIDQNYQCNMIITEQEIRELLNEEQYKHWQEISIIQAENQIQNAFHCKTRDCKGWCVYEDEVNFFECMVCGNQNCLTCKAIHAGQNCKEYQEELKVKAKNDDNAKQTEQYLNEEIKKGEAMHCPKCDVIIQKKLGCDWIRCTVCKTEICWATKGPRWGPGGKGDTSGGCKCRHDGKTPCVPSCRNCH